eukprot:15483542-Alexandrium_andersonii.AAC.1
MDPSFHSFAHCAGQNQPGTEHPARRDRHPTSPSGHTALSPRGLIGITRGHPGGTGGHQGAAGGRLV